MYPYHTKNMSIELKNVLLLIRSFSFEELLERRNERSKPDQQGVTLYKMRGLRRILVISEDPLSFDTERNGENQSNVYSYCRILVALCDALLKCYLHNKGNN